MFAIDFFRLLSYQGVAQACVAAFADRAVAPGFRWFALANFLLFPCGLLLWATRWLWAHTRGRAAAVHFKRRSKHWTDHKKGHAHTHIIRRFGTLFVDFRPSGRRSWLKGMPEGMPVLLAQKMAVAVCVGALRGPSQSEQRAQTACLVAAFLALAAYVALRRPFIRDRTNAAEALVALLQGTFHVFVELSVEVMYDGPCLTCG